MIRIEYCTSDKINIDPKEILRYLGYGNNDADSAVTAVIEKCIAKIQPKLYCKACYDRFDLSTNADGSLNLGFIDSDSKNLSKNLKDCKEIIVFTATIGIETDRIIGKYSAVSPLNAVVAQATGTAAIEAWCDILCRRFEKAEQSNGNYLRPRFSPGYGDFPLTVQKRIFEVLDCSRKIGVTLTDSFLMMPSKSVSAIIGISKNNLNCTVHGCEMCNKTQCEYKRGN